MARTMLPEDQVRALQKSIQQEVTSQMQQLLETRIASLERRLHYLENGQLGRMEKAGKSSSLRFDRQCCYFPDYNLYSSLEQEPSELKALNSRWEDIGERLEESVITAHASEIPLPESMFNYCMQRLAASSHPLQESALLWWLLLFFVQFMTMAAFVVYNDVDNNAIGVSTPASRTPAVSNCVFAKSSIFGIPLLQYLIGFVAIILVASAIRCDDEYNLLVTYPEQHSVCLFKNFAWFWQSVYVPACFSLEAATMFASSADALGVVMNTLAVTFILEIDQMLYHNLLSEELKHQYQTWEGKPRHNPSKTASRGTWALFTLNVVLMATMFTVMSATIGETSLHGAAYLNWYWFFICPFYFTMYAGRCFLQYLFHESEIGCSCWNGLTSFAAGAGGIVIYCLSVFFATAKFRVPPFTHYTVADFQACGIQTAPQ